MATCPRNGQFRAVREAGHYCVYRAGTSATLDRGIVSLVPLHAGADVPGCRCRLVRHCVLGHVMLFMKLLQEASHPGHPFGECSDRCVQAVGCRWSSNLIDLDLHRTLRPLAPGLTRAPLRGRRTVELNDYAEVFCLEDRIPAVVNYHKRYGGREALALVAVQVRGERATACTSTTTRWRTRGASALEGAHKQGDRI